MATEKKQEVKKTDDKKQKALETALSQIEKQYGKGAIMRLGQNSSLNIEHISTGSLTLDIALGIGGLPRGRIVEIYGPESSGKTTLSLHCIAEGQKNGGNVAFIDVEHALDPVYAAALGVDIDNLLVSQPDTGEQALEITEALIRSGAIDVIVLDSVAALVTKQEIEGDMGDSHVGVQARLMSQALRKLAGAISKSNCVAIFINQLREKVGVVYGNPEVTPGGRALKFYSSVRLEVRKGEALKAGKSSGDRIGSRTKVKVVKNKVAPPFKEAEFDIVFGKGISRVGELLDLAVEADIVNKSGAWFSYEGTRLGQGRDNVKQLFLDNPELAKEIEDKVMANIETLSSRSLKQAKPKMDDETEPTDTAEPMTTPSEDERAAKRSSVAAKKANIDILVED
ncbi:MULTISPECIES: recombinase RecA [unclassified Ruminococcus]|uniref:recombinase RecA n=1 Tax=unclassified Ruminococcus TaxID=2608920 RepID=UPI00210D0CB6|nr:MULTISPECIES: recombinase RecA [unclassified Ruminococcus]MCQ4021985.1 recombinase RecA [Ruminococcus sp. zg-924]MCQ4114521.1 recombinase RecA [Ruminococcus sp. zg-921]